MRSCMTRILMQTGGPYHPVAAQAELIRSWLPAGWSLETADGAEVFDRLDGADLYVASGLHWPGMDGIADERPWREAGAPKVAYVVPTERQREAFRGYVRSGRPILAFHGGILSFDDWPEYGALVGFRWDMGFTGHSVVADWKVQVDTDRHPVVAGVKDYVVKDELYYNVQTPAELDVVVHARAPFAECVSFPMVMTAEGGGSAGGGRRAYLANGHSMEAMEPPAIRQVWVNVLHWLLRR